MKRLMELESTCGPCPEGKVGCLVCHPKTDVRRGITGEKSYFEAWKEEHAKKLTDVGFTSEQAEVLLDIMQKKVLSGGLF